jgi:predicted ATPase
MIEKIIIRDFKAHRETRIPLGRLTMLVGDNASGKTSVLDALALQAAFNLNPVEVLRGDCLPDDFLRRGSSGPVVFASTGRRDGQPWSTSIKLSVSARAVNESGSPWALELTGAMGGKDFHASASGQGGGGTRDEGWTRLGSTLGTARLYRLRADKIAAATYSSETAPVVKEDGANTVVVLESMKLSNDEAFTRVEEALRRLIPSVARIRIRRAKVQDSSIPTGVGSKLYFDFHGAVGVPAHHASHGTLLVLALITILHEAGRPDVILLDDFDHALHPRAQMELVRMIKELLELEEFKDLQIVATTHSPYALDELDPSQVHAFAVNDDGTVASRRLSEHPEAQRMKGSLRAGQLWSLDPEREWVRGDKAA